MIAAYKRKADYQKKVYSLDRSPFLELKKIGFDVNEKLIVERINKFYRINN